MLNSDQFIFHLARYAKVPETEAEAFMQAVTHVLQEKIQSGEEVSIQGLGTFSVVETQQGKRMAFQIDDKMRESVNAPFTCFEPVVLPKGPANEVEPVTVSETEASLEEEAPSLEEETPEVEELPTAEDPSVESVEESSDDLSEEPVVESEPESAEELVEEPTDASAAEEEPLTEENASIEENTVAEENIPVEEETVAPAEPVAEAAESAAESKETAAETPAPAPTPRRSRRYEDDSFDFGKFWAEKVQPLWNEKVQPYLNQCVDEDKKLKPWAWGAIAAAGLLLILLVWAIWPSGSKKEAESPVVAAQTTTDTTAVATDSASVAPVAETEAAKPSADEKSSTVKETKKTASAKQEAAKPKPAETPRANKGQRPSDDMLMHEDGKAKQVQLSDGERLTLLALRTYGDKAFWAYIYEVNEFQLDNPNNVPTNVSLYLPDPTHFRIDASDPASIRRAQNRAMKILHEHGIY